MTRGLVEDIVISGLREGMVTRGLMENMVTSSDYISTSEIMLHLINYFFINETSTVFIKNWAAGWPGI